MLSRCELHSAHTGLLRGMGYVLGGLILRASMQCTRRYLARRLQHHLFPGTPAMACLETLTCYVWSSWWWLVHPHLAL